MGWGSAKMCHHRWDWRILRQGNGVFQPAVFYQHNGRGTSVVMGDFSGDGLPDGAGTG